MTTHLRDAMSRRQFFTRGTFVGSAAIGIMLSIPAIGFVLSPLFQKRRVAAARSIIVDPRDIPAGGDPRPYTTLVPLDNAGPATAPIERVVYVVRTGDGDENLLTLSNTCSHMQCNVHWDRSLQQFLCPCHGGLYDRAGTNVGGPPPSPLPRWRRDIEHRPDGSLRITVYNQFDESI